MFQVAAPSPASPKPIPEQRRDAFFDNAKYLAIVLVAIAHSWAPLRDESRTLDAAYVLVYAFHMPAFIIISGFFSRSFDMRPDRLKRLVTGIAVPYVIYEVAYSLFRRHFGDSPDLAISLLDPLFLVWFLAALFIWRLTTPLWKLVRYPLPVALVIAMLASVSPKIGEDFDLQRVLQFLPFFVLGLHMKPEHFRLVRRRAFRILAVPVFAGAAAFAWWASPRVDTTWVYHRDSAQAMGHPWWTGPLMTLAMFGCAVLLSACFFAWVPGRDTWFTTLGAGTLYGFLLHGFLLWGSEYAGWYDAAWLRRPSGEIFVTLVAAVAVTLLCTAPVRRVFRFSMEPRMEWAFRKDAAAPPGSGSAGKSEQDGSPRERTHA
ncbi:acyltransferase family protein [Streptomyces sp. NPDC057877]|uniref:acyltransferase family protein n=1 Tax=Streptomyces sp. NPDC057877 TaxID=3346269 RepID=UPI0036CF52F2